MRLTRLTIEMQSYGPNKGKYEGRVHFENHHAAAVEIPLNDNISREVLKVCADAVVEAGRDAARMITAEVIEHTTDAGLIPDQS